MCRRPPPWAEASAAGEPAADISDTTLWCLDGANREHVAAAADLLGLAEQRGASVQIGKDILSIDPWRRIAEADFDEACRHAYDLFGDGGGQPVASGGDDGGGGSDWLVAGATALGGALVGGIATHFGAGRRDRKLWTRQDAQLLHRLAGEVRYRADVAVASELTSTEGERVRATLRSAVAQLRSLLDDDGLQGDPEAKRTRDVLDELVSAIDVRHPNLTTITELAKEASELTIRHAARWAREISGM